MRSKNSHAGELIIDHRNSPGITPEFMRVNNLAGPCVVGGQTYETGIKNCAHCGGDVLLHPQRQRERGWCMSCDAYICDGCELLRKLGTPHKPYIQIISEIYEQNLKTA